ncbi:stalk domain-containing protein [Brevibacillus borstelensis]|uniref:stalk domain-containing protein n=1 Tax=Brevibacillus borstelensis TaxID=45462 RepID=UPI0030C5D65F
MRKMTSAVLAGILVAGFIGLSSSQLAVSAASSAGTMKVLFNGKELRLAEAPVVSNNRLLVPAESLGEALGATVAYDQAGKAVTFTKGANTYRLPFNSKIATMNGVSVSSDTAAILVNGKPYVPIRFLSEHLGVDVDYDPTARTVSLKASDAPSFQILSPAPHDILYTSQVEVSVAAFGHHLSDFRQNMQAKAGEGHIHIWLDTDPSDPKLAYKMIDGKPAVFDNVQPGTHKLTVQLVGNDHKPIQPEVKEEITFATTAVPALSVNGPKEGEAISGDRVLVQTAVSGFSLSDFRMKGSVAASEGHIHLWLDTDVSNPKLAVKQVNGDPVTFDNVKPGKHTLTVQLVGADHKPIQPEVKQVVHFTTTGKSGVGTASKSVVSNNHDAASEGSAQAAPQGTDHASHKASAPASGQNAQPAQSQSQAKSFQVDIKNFAFKPETLNIPAGTTVTFTNHDDVGHTVTAKDGSFDSGTIGKGKTYSMTFAKAGVYAIYCKPHNFMVDTITVK